MSQRFRIVAASVAIIASAFAVGQTARGTAGLGANGATIALDDKPAEKGTIQGVVKDKNGNPIADQLVRLTKPAPAGGGGGGGAVLKSAGFNIPEMFQKGPGGGPAKSIMRATSDAQGRFTFKDVPVGSYSIVASKQGVGFGRVDVSVQANQTSTVELKFQ